MRLTTHQAPTASLGGEPILCAYFMLKALPIMREVMSTISIMRW